MRVPFWVFYSSWLPYFFGTLFSHRPFQAMTIGPFIFAPKRIADGRVLIHEIRHVQHFWLAWIVGIAAFAIIRPSWFWLALTPFAYTVAYVVAGLFSLLRGGTFYHDCWFERDARRKAGEPVE